MRNHLTVRSLPPDVAKELEREKRRSGQSLNGTVIGLLRRALGLERQAKVSNGLRHLAGSWSEAEFKAFKKATETFEHIDREIWR